MGPVSYTVIHFERSPGTHAYQLAMPVIYEAGLKIYAEHGRKLLEWPGRELIKDIPAAWDESRFIEGLPASHIVIARRKGSDWYVAGMTESAFPPCIRRPFRPCSRPWKQGFSLREKSGRTGPTDNRRQWRCPCKKSLRPTRPVPGPKSIRLAKKDGASSFLVAGFRRFRPPIPLPPRLIAETKRRELGWFLPALFGFGAFFWPGQQGNGSERPTKLEMIK